MSENERARDVKMMSMCTVQIQLCMIWIDQMAPFRPPNYFLKNLLQFVLLLQDFNEKYIFSAATNFTKSINSLQADPNGLLESNTQNCYFRKRLRLQIYGYILYVCHALQNIVFTVWLTTAMTHFNRFSRYCLQLTQILPNSFAWLIRYRLKRITAKIFHIEHNFISRITLLL